MRRERQDHMVNILLPLALLLMFAISALAVLLFAAKIYRSTVENSTMNDESRTALSYVSEKIHSGDSSGCVRLESLQGVDALVLEQSYAGEIYCTYVYQYEGMLKELFVKAGTEIPLSAGRTILELESFSMTAYSDDLLLFTCTDHSGQSASAYVALRSEGGAAQ